MLLDYTTHDDVRALLGVERDELEDETIELHVFTSGMESDLYDVSPQLVDTFQDLLGKPEGEETAAERRVVSLTKSFATYSLARQLANSLSMFAPRTITDGKSSLTRFSGEPFREVLEGIESSYKLTRTRLINALEDLQADSEETVARPIFYTSVPSYDPVTGS